MQLRKTNLLLAALCATGLFLTACGDETSDGNALCAQDSECGDNEICSAGFCMQTCESAADCPDSNKNCVAQSSTSTQKVCKCQTDALCQGDSGNTDLKCDTASGACTTTGTGSGDDPATCTGEGQGTSTPACKYGTKYCSSGSCTALPAPTCNNYTNFANKSALGTNGIIIYSVSTGTVSTDSAFCGTATPKRVRIVVNAYNDEAFPATKDELSGMFYVTAGGAASDATQYVSSSTGNYTRFDNNRRAQITVSLCVAAGDTSTSTGFYFTGGNFFCHLASY